MSEVKVAAVYCSRTGQNTIVVFNFIILTRKNGIEIKALDGSCDMVYESNFQNQIVNAYKNHIHLKRDKKKKTLASGGA